MTYTVSGRTLSNSEILLGAKGDNEVEKIEFLLPRYTSSGVDLSLGIGYVVFRLPDNETDGQVVITPEVVDDDTVSLTLLVGSEMTAQKGRGKLCLKIAGLESAMWSSEIATTYVVGSIDMPSPQPYSMFRVMAVGAAARIAEVESEQPLTVTERTINIPAELQTIAVASDENSESVSIVVPRYFDGIDLSVYDFILHTEMAGNGVDDILFNNQNGQMKSVEDSTVTLTWVLRPPQTSYEGKLSIQLFVQGESFAWHSLIGELTIAKHLVGDPVVPTTPSLYEQWLAEITEQADYVRTQENNIQAVVNNMAAIKGAPAAAQSAAKSAEAAQTAAQQALGFRTFFSAVSPDENGDLDPSRPMTTSTAQASWTIKSKGDRIQSVQVNGFTQQAGTGDASPNNVREITVGGMEGQNILPNTPYNWYCNSVTFEGTDGTIQPLDVAGSYYFRADPGKTYTISKVGGNRFSIFSTETEPKVGVPVVRIIAEPSISKYTITSQARDNYICVYVTNTDTEVKVWVNNGDSSYPYTDYTDYKYAAPIFIEGKADTSCVCELTAPLCAGDKVESCVPSGCDMRLVLDGTESFSLATSPSNVFQAYNLLQNSENFTAICNDYGPGGNSWNNMPDKSVLNSSNILGFRDSEFTTVEDFKAMLAARYAAGNPVIVWLRSTAYTEANDIPVQLETHASAIVTVDGTNTLFTQGTDGYTVSLPGAANGAVTCNCFANLTAASNTVTIPSSQFPAGVTSLEQANTWAQSNPVTILYPLSTSAVYAHDPVELVAVPYTDADATTAQQLAATPSTLPYIDSADVPMLLDDAALADATGTTEEPTARPMTMAAPLSTALPVAGTYVVSSQDGTTVAVSLKAFQDGGNAATLDGMTLEDIKKLISDMIASASSGS